jgi:hypothetical protein
LPEQAALEVKAEIDRLVYDKLTDVSANATTADEAALLSMNFVENNATDNFKDVMTVRFAKIIARANRVFLARTGRQGLRNLIFGPDALDILTIVVDNASDQTDAFGPYKIGTFRNIGLYVDPFLHADQTGVTAGQIKVPVIAVSKSQDGKRAPLVLGEYMPLTPTNNLQLPDFTNMQGWATSCVVEVLNDVLCAQGSITVSA